MTDIHTHIHTSLSLLRRERLVGGHTHTYIHTRLGQINSLKGCYLKRPKCKPLGNYYQLSCTFCLTFFYDEGYPALKCIPVEPANRSRRAPERAANHSNSRMGKRPAFIVFILSNLRFASKLQTHQQTHSKESHTTNNIEDAARCFPGFLQLALAVGKVAESEATTTKRWNAIPQIILPFKERARASGGVIHTVCPSNY